VTFSILFLAMFVAGLGLAVYSMLQGVERSRPSGTRRPSAFFNTPTASAFGLTLGAIGYLLATRSTLAVTTILIIAILAASAAVAGMVTLMSRWALPYSGIPTEDDGVQGQLALVTRPIFASHPGEIVFQANGARRVVAAESIQGSEIPADTEVVIDTIENGIARVELWSAVEQRL
jgi:hypothetical protein